MKARNSREGKAYYITLWLKGFCMGAADVVPGVSGGTMAFILGIYEKLIRDIRAFDWSLLKMLLSGRFREAEASVPWRFLAAVLIGIFTAIFSLARMISWLLENQPILIWSFFFGLILASVVTVGKKFQSWKTAYLFWILAGTLGAYWLVGLVPMTTPNAAWYLFLSGAIAICAMILPGISGSFILVLLGKYQYVLDAVNNRDIATLAIVAAGAAVGLILFSRLLNWLFRRHHDLTIAILCGLMIGSLRKVWPWKEISSVTDAAGHGAVAAGNILPVQWTTEVTIAVVLALVGIAAVLAIDWWADRQT